MQNRDLASDFLHRAAIRLRAVEVLFEAASWADVVRESQEIVGLAFKGLLRSVGIELPRVHDVSEILLTERSRLPSELAQEAEKLAGLSCELRRDRELAFYGAEDLTPSELYTRADAERALAAARETVRQIEPHVGPPKRDRPGPS